MTNNLDNRLAEHNQGMIEACYTYSRRPLILKYFEQFQYVNDAILREKQIKGWSRKKKEALIREDFAALVRLAKKYGSKDKVDGQQKKGGQ